MQFAVTARPTEQGDYIMTIPPEASGPNGTVKYSSINSGGGALGLYSRQPA